METSTVSTAGRPLDRNEASEFLRSHGFKVAAKTLAQLAYKGGGPRFVSFGRRPLYDPAELLAWAQGRCSGPRRSTSDAGVPESATGAAA